MGVVLHVRIFFSPNTTTAALRAAEILAKFLLYGTVRWKRPDAQWLVYGAGGAAQAFAVRLLLPG